MLPGQYAAHDVASGAVGERVEQGICPVLVVSAHNLNVQPIGCMSRAGRTLAVIVVSFRGSLMRESAPAVSLGGVSATYFWFSRPAPGGSVGVTTR